MLNFLFFNLYIKSLHLNIQIILFFTLNFSDKKCYTYIKQYSYPLFFFSK